MPCENDDITKWHNEIVTTVVNSPRRTKTSQDYILKSYKSSSFQPVIHFHLVSLLYIEKHIN